MKRRFSFVTQSRQGIDPRGPAGRNPGGGRQQRRDTDSTAEGDALLLLAVLGIRQQHAHCQRVLRAKAGVDGLRQQEAAHQMAAEAVSGSASLSEAFG